MQSSSDSEDDANGSDFSLAEALKQATPSAWHFSWRVAISRALELFAHSVSEENEALRLGYRDRAASFRVGGLKKNA